MESGGVIWIGTCSVGRNVEHCAMWNEVECELWDGMWKVVRCGMR